MIVRDLIVPKGDGPHLILYDVFDDTKYEDYHAIRKFLEATKDMSCVFGTRQLQWAINAIGLGYSRPDNHFVAFLCKGLIDTEVPNAVNYFSTFILEDTDLLKSYYSNTTLGPPSSNWHIMTRVDVIISKEPVPPIPGNTLLFGVFE